ncbi:MAG: hypothetical protein KKC37_06830 [Proteobacteria bacterium]|nr:hypothetical protein [Pseudomonadota bacterium]
MLKIRPIINSGVDEIFGFKTCCGARAFDQNLELLLTNQGPTPLTIPSHCDLETDRGPERVDYLMPHGPQRIAPGETRAFYCQMDDSRWRRVTRIVFYDTQGRSYAADLKPEPNRAGT